MFQFRWLFLCVVSQKNKSPVLSTPHTLHLFRTSQFSTLRPYRESNHDKMPKACVKKRDANHWEKKVS